MSVVASCDGALMPKRAAPNTLNDLESITNLGRFFDLLDLPNGAGKQVGDHSTISGEPARKKLRPTKKEKKKTEKKRKEKTASTTTIEDLESLYAWVFLPQIPDDEGPPRAHQPSPQYPVPFSERPTVSISGKTEAMLRRYVNLFNRGTKPGGDPANVMLRLPVDWRDPRITGPSLPTENVHSRLNELEETIEALKSSLVPNNSVTANSRATSEPASQKRYNPQDATVDFRWSIWRHYKYTLFNDHDKDHNELVRLFQGTDFKDRVAFVDRAILEKESPEYRARRTGRNDPSKTFDFDPLLSEVIYDTSIRPQAPSETDVTEKWSPIWIERYLGKVDKLSPDKAISHLNYLLAHLKDINGSVKALEKVDDIELDPDYLASRNDYYYWRDRYLHSPQKMIEGAIGSGYRFASGHPFRGELAVERSYNDFIAILRYDALTELNSGRKLYFPRVMQPFKTIPKPDISFRMIPNLWSTDPSLCHTAPAIFIGEAKFHLATKDVLAQIAISVHPNLLLMALYYLDHRKYDNDPTPDWLFFFSIQYFAKGFIIHGHYFDWHITEKRFKFYMVPVGKDFRTLMATPSKVMKLKAIRALGSVRSHNCFIAEVLRRERWKGTLREKYEELCKLASPLV